MPVSAVPLSRGWCIPDRRDIVLVAQCLVHAHHEDNPIRTVGGRLSIRLAVAPTEMHVVRPCGVEDNIDESTADFKVPLRIVGIDDQHRHRRIALKIPVLTSRRCMAEADVLAIELVPHRIDLNRPVGTKRPERPKQRPLEQVDEVSGDVRCHRCANDDASVPRLTWLSTGAR